MTTKQEAMQAEMFARAQRALLAAYLLIDNAMAGDPEAIALCEQVKAAAAKNPVEYDRLLHSRAVVALFTLGALRFEAPHR